MSDFEIIKIKRRQLLKLLLGSGLVFLPGVAIAQKSNAEREILALAKSLSGNMSVQRMGNLYISKFPDENIPVQHVRYIEDRILNTTDKSIDQLESMIHCAIREDFRNEMITDINGWKVSCTEAHMYALCALLA